MTDCSIFFHNQRGKRTILIITLLFTIVVVIFTTGCTGEQKIFENKNYSHNLTEQFTKEIPIKKSIPIPETAPSQSKNQVTMVDFQNFLTDWNGKMHWGFSTQQIENYNRTLQNDLLKQYRIKPDYPDVDIPDIYPFCLELGNELGLTKNQTEIFATAADVYYRESKMAHHTAPPLDSLSLENCSLQINRGDQKQINITYQPYVNLGSVTFGTIQTPLTLAFSPSSIIVKPYSAYQGVAVITASPSLEPGIYQFGVMIDERKISELHCNTGSPSVDYGKLMINVTVQ